MTFRDVILPGSTIGILGDGQLGQMTAIAAATLGYKVAVLGPGGRESPAGHVAYWAKKWEPGPTVSYELLDEFCNLVSVVLIEWENVPLSLVDRIQAKGLPVRPSGLVLQTSQDRYIEKSVAMALNIPTPRFAPVRVTDRHAAYLLAFECDTILKTRCDGYDGKGQVRIPKGHSVDAAWNTLHLVPCILEEFVNFAYEISVIVARSPNPDSKLWPFLEVYGPFENEHEDGILRRTIYPVQNSNLTSRKLVAKKATNYAVRIANHLDVHGLLAVEFFVDANDQIFFNEMSPRPHNSGHLTIECCRTSQFEQYIRAACNLPLGSTHMICTGEMINMIGSDVERWNQPLVLNNSLHLYGKVGTKPGRKMGHYTKRIL